MIKLNIHNMESFLQEIDKCSNNVFLIRTDGHKRLINHCIDTHSELKQNYYDNNRYLSISLDISNYKDYLNLIFYYISNI